ncbi:lysophospholipid acyltransferase family protein [Solirubrum puertoriconensis]|uniref:lysophospholipid acyltransferase family protein n=1 Tax=Solirubrum puertoriconensis TaxID=1751427 RepID=UPI000A980D11|nr:lysophospholipid acyltransferase family protein [Solirubrum puertoriconensis]
MRRLLQYLGHRIYTTWATFWFVMPFVVTYPLQWLLSRQPKWHRYLHALNRVWSILFIRMWGIPVAVVRKQPLPAGQPCVYVPNHSSYIDIPLLFKAIPGHLNIMGKSSLSKVPLWGPIFERGYISVDRESRVSRGRALVQARQTLDAGRSVVIFPEGAIAERPGEELLPFKDGPFLLAIAAGVPIVPVTMPYNHRFMPDVGGLRVRYSPLRIVLHAPISTQGLTPDDLPALKERVRAIIASEFDPKAAGVPAPSPFVKVRTTQATAEPSNTSVTR